VNRAIRHGATVLCLAASAAAAYNVFSDNTDVEKEAERAACGGDGSAVCHPQMSRSERSPFAQTFELSTSKRTVEVKCARAWILVGDYACTLRP